MSIDTIIKLIDELRQVAYKHGYTNAEIDLRYGDGFLEEHEMEDLQQQGDEVEGIADGVYAEIVKVLYDLEEEDEDPNIVDWDNFLELYEPVPNTEEVEGDGLASFLLDKPPVISEFNIWTVYDLEDGICLMPGAHHIDAVGYVQTVVTWFNRDLEIRVD
jgi:hypothetical protein